MKDFFLVNTKFLFKRKAKLMMAKPKVKKVKKIKEDIWNKNIRLNHKKSNSIVHILNHENESKKFQTLSSIPSQSYSLSSIYQIIILDQENIGSCVTCAFSGIEYIFYKIHSSILFRYYCSRLANNLSPYEDTGLDLSDALPTFQTYGSVPSNYYPYLTSNFSREPPLSVYQQSSLNYPILYSPIPQSNNAFQTSLLNNRPIIFGLNVYSSFMTNNVAQRGIIPIPKIKKEKKLGGHCMFLIGYTTFNNQIYYQAVNSWGYYWGCSISSSIDPNYLNNGNGGCCWIPSAYLTNNNLSYEFFSCYIN